MTNALHKSLFRDIHSRRIIPDDKKKKINGGVARVGTGLISVLVKIQARSSL